MKAAAAAALILTATPSLDVVTRDAYLMGTRARLVTYAPSRESGIATLETGLRVLEETERELSTWRDDSAISGLNRHPVGEPWPASPRVCRLLSEVFEWSRASGGAFDPGIGTLIDAWDVHGDGRIPSTTALADARARSGATRIAFDRTRCHVTRLTDVSLDVGGFGKGEALDRVAAALGPVPWMVDLGGQVSVGGTMPPAGFWEIDIADPRDRSHPSLRVRVTGGSVSTSAGSERDHTVNGARVGHILDPRLGAPVAFTGSVTVWHERALVADILSTALYVMGPAEGLRWAEARGVAAAYLIPDGGGVRMMATPAFTPLIAPE